jgi:serine/threonine protein kinase/tetratricopeptide (TPR) repeat protein
MNPERWQQVKVLFESALDHDPSERAAFLDDACRDDHELRDEIQSLLAAESPADGFFDDLELHAGQLLGDEEDDPVPGKRIGPYKITQKLGSGGMGSVYLGIRSDDQFQKRVAIKLIRSGFNSEFLINRFRKERQILANLDHPNIAMLLDGGATDEGLPYLVMEYVEGSPIDEYCAANNKGTAERLKLFRQVCSAVHHAHQNLIVHRDLKPSNIMVTSEGAPKLLDFGIAKLLDPLQETEETGTVLGLMTPEYASPEQVRGQAITTASDTYSLGVVLYRLLTGHHPYRIKSRAPEEILRVVCEEEPRKPSAAVTRAVEEITAAGASGGPTVAMEQDVLPSGEEPDKLRRRLTGDLDMIVMMAMRKEPVRRYGSVEQFSEDIRRHLEGLPVIARKDTFSYRATKFATRHKLGVAAAGLIFLAIMGSAWQAYNARVQKTRAERVSSDLAVVVNNLMFQVDDSIKDLQGSIPARRLLVTRGVEYLDSLANDAGNNAENRRQLASAYLRFGDIQGRPGFANLGDTAGALTSYTKALQMREALASSGLKDPEFERELAINYERMGDVLRVTGKSDLAMDRYRKARAIRDKLPSDGPDATGIKIELAGNYQRLGDMYGIEGNPKEGLGEEMKAVEILEPVIAGGSAEPEVRRTLQLSYIKEGDMLAATGDPHSALESYRKAVPISEGLVQQFPDNARYHRELAASLDKVGNALSAIKDTSSAIILYQKALGIREELASKDAKNAQAHRDLSISYDKIGSTLAKSGQYQPALDYYEKALKNDQTLAENDPGNDQAAEDLSISYLKFANMQLKIGSAAAALENYRSAMEIRERLSAADPSDVEARNNLGEAYLKMGDAYSALGAVQGSSISSRAEDWKQARDWYQKSLTVISALQDAGQLGQDNEASPDQIKRQIAQCDTELSRLGGAGPR